MTVGLTPCGAHTNEKSANGASAAFPRNGSHRGD